MKNSEKPSTVGSQDTWLRDNTKLSWLCSNGSWIYNYICNQCYYHWSCEFESRSGEVYSIQYYVIKFVSDLRQVVSSTNKTFRDDKTEILLKVALRTITITPLRLYGIREHQGLPPYCWWCPCCSSLYLSNCVCLRSVSCCCRLSIRDCPFGFL